MEGFDNLASKVNTSAQSHDDAMMEASRSLNRELHMISAGVGSAALDTVTHPVNKLAELGISMGTGVALGVCSRLGASGRFIAAGVGAAMMFKFGHDEITGSRWSNLGTAIKDTWNSADNLDRNTEITKNSLGSFVVDTSIGYAGMATGSFCAARFAPPDMLMKDALNRSGTDRGAAVLNLQNRWENQTQFQNAVAGKLELVAHSEPAVKGEPRGDLIRVASIPDGKILLSAMDAQGHGLKAAKRAVELHAAFDDVMPKTGNTNANDILSMIDKKLSTKEVVGVTAGMMTYDPVTHELQTATASCELAYVVRANGAVQRLDAKIGGQGLGLNWYSKFPRGNEITRLEKGDTVLMVSDGVFERFGSGNWGGLPESTIGLHGFEKFLETTGPNPKGISDGIRSTAQPKTGIDDASFIVFRRL